MVREITHDDLALVRRFNRTITERIGELGKAFLGRGRPLGASRLLWEVGQTGAELQDPRDRLGLDSGYASRLVRNLEDAGLFVAGGIPPTGHGGRPP